ncbi:MAG: nucleotidyl transferase AbiEii/AbiGii toxin family protein [Candidatus Omnitrophota bacterium]|nr:nucleotidyl transferase AbiEii/AbiGii toxin family protein [Candidatus Omnitrophota bacterium]
MFIEKLPAKTKATLVRVADLPLPTGTYLAGGTAALLHLGHRLSDDIDLFTPERFEPSVLVQAIQRAGTFELERTSWGTILGWLNGLRFSLFHYTYPVLYPYSRFQRLPVANLKDIAAMKIAAISDRGSRKDFIDLYGMCKTGLSLREALRLYDRKYGALQANRVHIYKSLVYFEEAEQQAMPMMLRPFHWDALKTFFEREVRKLNRR